MTRFPPAVLHADPRFHSSEPDALDLFTVYESPSDAPGMFVVRRWVVVRGESDALPAEAFQFYTLDMARAAIPRGRVSLPREHGDDPTIVETWV